MEQEQRPKRQSFLLILGVLAIIGGISMALGGIDAIRTGKPIPATRWSKSSTGSVDLVLGGVIVVFGMLVIRCYATGRDFRDFYKW